MSAFACKMCIASKGLKGSDIKNLPKTEEELFVHIEEEHGTIVKRKTETWEQAKDRFYAEHPDLAHERKGPASEA